MNKLLLIVLAFCVCATVAVDQSPIASLACQMCSSGSPLSAKILPPGTTCVDLDIAMQNIGKDGCFGLQGALEEEGIDQNNATEVWAYAQELEDELDSEKAKNRNLILVIVGLSVTVVATCVGSGVIVWCLVKKDSEEEVYKHIEGRAPTNHHGGLVLLDAKDE
jgi:hypothetical protein